jgi:hypothetical protein
MRTGNKVEFLQKSAYPCLYLLFFPTGWRRPALSGQRGRRVRRGAGR